MAKEGYWEGWGFNDTFKVSLTGQAKDVSSAVKELKQAFPKNEVKKYSTKSLYVFVYDNEVPIVKKIAKMFNLKVSYETGGLAGNEKLVYVLYDPTPRAIKIFNENGRTYLNWWQSDLNRGESEQLLKKLQMQNLILGGLRYTGDTSDLKFEQGGNIGEALASSNPYIGGAKVIQGIAPESVSALDKKMARKINPDPNRPIFFNNGGGVDIIAPFGTLVSKNKQQKLEYKKVGSNFEFMIYEGLMNPVSNYSRTSFKKTKNGSISMNYDEFLKFIYSNGFVDDQKYALGGGVPRKMELYDAVLYGGKQYDISIKNGVVGLKNLSQGAWGSDYPFIPLSKVNINNVTDMYGNKVEIAEKYVKGGGIGKKEPKYFVFEVSYSMRKRGENRNQAGLYKQTITESATTEKGAEREAIKTIRSMHKYENVVFNHIAPKLIQEMTLLEYIESQRPRKYDNGGLIDEIKTKYQLAGNDSSGVYTYSKRVADEIASKYGGDVQQDGSKWYVSLNEKYALGGKILASSSSKEGLNKIIEQYLYGSTITLVETENDKIYEVHNKKGKTPFYVEFKRGKYNFIQPTKFDNGGSVGQTDYSVAQTILNQLGGMKRLVIMTGAYNFVASTNAVSFRIKNRKVNYIKITLNGKDLYDVKFSRIFNYQEKVVAELNDIYFDQLIPIFEQNTGMYLKMFKKGGMVSTQNRDMIISQLKAIHHHQKEMLDTLKNSGEVEAWVLAKVSNASSNLSDIAHYLEFKE